MSEVKALLAALKEQKREVYFRPNPGNAGDSLINMGFFSLAQAIGLDFKLLSDDQELGRLSPAAAVITSGGGNIVPYWEGGSKTLRTLLQYQFPIYMMPQSIEGRAELLGTLRAGDVLFLRENFSRSYAESLQLNCEVASDHDLAFFLERGYVEAAAPLLPKLSGKNLVRLGLLGYHFLRSRFIKSVRAYRTDIESTSGGNFPLRNDLSLVCKFGDRTLAENAFSAKWFLRLLSWYDLVETDRLHVMIGCVLVGTRVKVKPNRYHKIQGVYEFSIAPGEARQRNCVEWG